MFRQQFAGLSFFQGFTPEQIAEICPIMEAIPCEKDAVIFQQNQRTDYLYILEEGEVVIQYKPYDGPPMVIARIHPGGVFGWSAALGRDVYTSGAQALAPGRAIRMQIDSLQQFCSQHPETGKILLERLASVIAERLKSTYNEVLNILTNGLDHTGDCWRRIEKP
ncbi:protein containg cyclic nucleotide-binding domain [Longilinea arvoryzae]|uniref:Protein containg cyclic nucleotide-binding domain n=1 Tax=Longilinea arvoryzae TaxID=360412 RepID=A0A0S7BCN1_9CHLR|nr:cyclic nucleotide-binding domain-containing protein [Longilinea arvoryzae]GAP15615.1 protein containg cyclic nucleotide-binding domain [Longilinea arvoryzae]